MSVQGLLTIEDVAKALKVSERTAWALVKRGQIGRVKIGRSVRVRPGDLKRYVNRQAGQGGLGFIPSRLRPEALDVYYAEDGTPED